MISVPEMAEEFVGHPAALEGAASLREVQRGVRAQFESLPTSAPSRPLRAPAHVAQLRGFILRRQSELAQRGQRVAVADPARFAFRSLLGARTVEFGFVLNLEYVYQSPRGGEYVITGIVTGYEDGRLTGEGWARECSCPDFQKRRGPARDQLQGEERCCKHMRLFLAQAYLWQGRTPWIGIVPAAQRAPGAGFQLREF